MIASFFLNFVDVFVFHYVLSAPDLCCIFVIDLHYFLLVRILCCFYIVFYFIVELILRFILLVLFFVLN